MPIDRRALGASLALALLVAACGGSSTASPSAAASQAAATDQTASSDQPASTDQAAATDNGGAQVSLTPGSAPELEAMLPSTVNGIAFTKSSFGGGSIPAGIPLGSDQLSQLLKDNGKTVSDFAWAMATPADSASASTFVIAFQVKGVDGNKIADALGAASGGGMQTATVGGKQVKREGAAGMGAVLYIKNDVVFYILDIGNATLTDAIVAALP